MRKIIFKVVTILAFSSGFLIAAQRHVTKEEKAYFGPGVALDIKVDKTAKELLLEFRRNKKRLSKAKDINEGWLSLGHFNDQLFDGSEASTRATTPRHSGVSTPSNVIAGALNQYLALLDELRFLKIHNWYTPYSFVFGSPIRDTENILIALLNRTIYYLDSNDQDFFKLYNIEFIISLMQWFANATVAKEYLMINHCANKKSYKAYRHFADRLFTVNSIVLSMPEFRPCLNDLTRMTTRLRHLEWLFYFTSWSKITRHRLGEDSYLQPNIFSSLGLGAYFTEQEGGTLRLFKSDQQIAKSALFIILKPEKFWKDRGLPSPLGDASSKIERAKSSPENFEFIQRLVKTLSGSKKEPQIIGSKLLGIYERHVPTGSEAQINIDSDMYTDLEKSYKKYKNDPASVEALRNFIASFGKPFKEIMNLASAWGNTLDRHSKEILEEHPDQDLEESADREERVRVLEGAI